MKRLILLLVVLNFGYINGQNNNVDRRVIIVENDKYNNLYFFEKKNIKVNIKVLYYSSRKEGFKTRKQNNKNIAKDDVIVVNAEPSTNYYEFNSLFPPEKISDISGLKIYSIEDVSKNNIDLFQNNYSPFFFLEKLSCEKYNLWKMKLEILE